jgi:hypothetical protein
MTDKPSGGAHYDRDLYLTNRSRFTPDELAPYGDQWVAWSGDGSRIVAHDEDLLKVAEQVKALGYGSEDVLLERIPPGGEVDSQL